MDQDKLIQLITILRDNGISFYKDKDLELHVDLKYSKGLGLPDLLKQAGLNGIEGSAIPQEKIPTEDEFTLWSAGFDESEIRTQPIQEPQVK